jgi:hypothetical protein
MFFFLLYLGTVYTLTKHWTLWIYCSFSNNLFWSLKFYFVQFDPNWRLIAYDFLVKS